MGAIRILPDHLVSQIAAGEVVERPASVVKELIENSLDAGAAEISVELESGGRRLIRVVDDGGGMDREDALLAFDRHATSKIASFEDLEHVATLGFRGEALASVAAVSTVDLLTAPDHGEGVRIRVDAGRVESVEPARRARGTTVEVRRLFHSVPARRKFLKTGATELRRSAAATQGYALARPAIRFRLLHGGREVLRADPATADLEGLRERVRQLFGEELTEHLVRFGRPAEAGEEAIWGLLGDRTTTRGRRVFIFVNRRLVRDRALSATFYSAVRHSWHQDDFPALFLFLDLPPDRVDVNVHPQKSEVRFRDPSLTDRVGAVLRRALEEARGAEPAPLRFPDRQGWTGAAASPLSWHSGEGTGPAGHLAEPVYRPLERAPVRLSGATATRQELRLIGQYKGTLILLEGPDGLLLIDQHVAHERVLYERLRRQLAGERVPVQELLEPQLISANRAETMRLLELVPELGRCGFELVELSGGTLGLTAIPSSLDVETAGGLLEELATRGDAGEGSLAERLLDGLAATVACKAAVKMHDPLTPESMEQLVRDLFAAEQPHACPHGRPIILKMDDADLERRFGRR